MENKDFQLYPCIKTPREKLSLRPRVQSMTEFSNIWSQGFLITVCARVAWQPSANPTCHVLDDMQHHHVHVHCTCTCENKEEVLTRKRKIAFQSSYSASCS